MDTQADNDHHPQIYLAAFTKVFTKYIQQVCQFNNIFHSCRAPLDIYHSLPAIIILNIIIIITSS